MSSTALSTSVTSKMGGFSANTLDLEASSPTRESMLVTAELVRDTAEKLMTCSALSQSRIAPPLTISFPVSLVPPSHPAPELPSPAQLQTFTFPTPPSYQAPELPSLVETQTYLSSTSMPTKYFLYRNFWCEEEKFLEPDDCLRPDEEFNQDSLTIPDGIEFDELRNLQKKYQGLCEIICNYILATEFKTGGNGFLKHPCSSISSQNINNPLILKSHCLDVYSFFERSMIYLGLGDDSDRIFSIVGHSRRIKSKDFNLLCQKLENFKNGKIFKVLVYNKFAIKFLTGHSMLLMKSGDSEYVFFDPNNGKYLKLSSKNLRKLLTRKSSGYRNVVVLDSDNYFKKLISHNLSLFSQGRVPTLDVPQTTGSSQVGPY